MNFEPFPTWRELYEAVAEAAAREEWEDLENRCNDCKFGIPYGEFVGDAVPNGFMLCEISRAYVAPEFGCDQFEPK